MKEGDQDLTGAGPRKMSGIVRPMPTASRAAGGVRTPRAGGGVTYQGVPSLWVNTGIGSGS